MIQAMTTLMTRKENKKGFTLVELIIVIAIIAILVAVLLPRFAGFTDKAKQTQYLTNSKQLATAIDSYLAEGNTTFTKDQLYTFAGVASSAGVVLKVTRTGASQGAVAISVTAPANPAPATGSWYFGRNSDTDKVKVIDSAAFTAIVDN